MFQHIEPVDRVEGARNWSIVEIMDSKVEGPGSSQPQSSIVYENSIEIGRGQRLDLLPHDACAKSISASNLQNVSPPGEHFSDKFIASECKDEMLRILAPALAAHKPEPLKAPRGDIIHAKTVLTLSGHCLPGQRSTRTLLIHSHRHNSSAMQLVDRSG